MYTGSSSFHSKASLMSSKIAFSKSGLGKEPTGVPCPTENKRFENIHSKSDGNKIYLLFM
jgi:hypothetical protein